MVKATLLIFVCMPLLAVAQKPLFPTDIRNIDSLIAFCTEHIQVGKLDTSLEVIEKVEREISEANDNKSVQYAKCCLAFGRIYHQKNNFEKAEPWYLKAINLIQKLLGKENLEYAVAAGDLGSLYIEMGHYEQAELFLLEAKYIWDNTNDKENKQYSLVLISLGILSYNTGQYQSAEALYLEAIKIQKKIFGTEHPEYARSLSKLGNLYWTMGQYEIAEPIYIEAKNIQEKNRATEDPSYANSLHNLSALYSDLGDFDKAELFLLKAKAIREKILGKEHRDYVSTLINLGILYIDMGQARKAEPLFVEACSIWSKTLGKNHPDLATVLSNLGGLYIDLEQYQKAEPLLLQAKEIREKVLGKEHPDYASSVENLAILYSSIQQNAKSEQYHLEAIALKEKVLGKEHPDYALSLYNLGSEYFGSGKYKQAESLYLKACSIREKTLGNEHPTYALNLNELANLYVKMGLYDKADSIYQKLYPIYLNIITKAAHHLSEKEMNDYLYIFAENQNQILTFAQISGRISIIPTCYNNSLFYKGYLLNAVQRGRQLALSDSSTSFKYNLLKSYERSLASQYAQAIEDRDSTIISELEAKANKIEKELARTFKDWGQANRQIQWQEVKSQLKAGEAAIEFVHYNLWNIEQKDTIMYAALILLPEWETPKFICLFNEKELEALLASTSSMEKSEIYLSRGAKPVIQNNLTNLYSLVWKPLDSFLTDVKKIYFSLSGMLHRLNFNAIQMSNGHTLSDQYEMVELGSTRQLVIPGSFKASANDAILFGGLNYNAGLSGPISFPSDTKQNTENAEVHALNGWNYLPGTMAEVNEIANVLDKNKFKATSLVQTQGSEVAFKNIGKTNPSPRILHLATHGFFFPDPGRANFPKSGVDHDPDSIGTTNEGNAKAGTPMPKMALETKESVFRSSDHPMLRSGLILAGGNAAWQGKQMLEGGEDGILTAYEISQMNLSNTELVVLSACETGLGDIQDKEGVYGLQRAFKIAGVKYIIMSLWQVPDKETSEFMTTFYKNWIDVKMDIPEAFRFTQKEMRERYTDPYQWAGFVLVE